MTVPRIKPPRTPRSLRSVKLNWLEYAKLRFTAINTGQSLSAIAGAAITSQAQNITPEDIGIFVPVTEGIYLNLKLLPEEAVALDNLALRLELAVDRNVSLSDAFRAVLLWIGDPKPPLGTSDDLALWLKTTYSRYRTARPERPYRAGWQEVGPGFLSEQRRAIRTARRARARNLGRRR